MPVLIDEVSDSDLKGVALVANSNQGVTASRPSWRARIKYYTGLDRAIGFTVLARAWTAVAGAVTVLLIAHFLTPSEQGYYYTFFSLAAVQIVFELGFAFVVMQLAAHECAQLSFASDGSITGDPIAHSRLASVLQRSVLWYSVAAVLMLITLLPVGSYFFGLHQHASQDVSWKAPWYLLVMATALTFQLDPVCGFIEGCGYVSQIAHMRLIQAFLGSVLVWTTMVTHHGLFSPAMLVIANGTVQIGFLAKRRRFLIGLLRHKVAGDRVVWRQEIWPFQWRIAITWLSSYLISQIFNPVLFTFQGPVAAGRMGMSLSITTSIGSVGLAWMSTKASPFGMMVARGETSALDRVFFRTLWQSTALIAAAAAGFFVCLEIAGRVSPQLVMRVLSPWAFALLLLTTVMNHVVLSEALYMRTHKREPLLVQAVVIAIILSISTVLLAHAWGANAVTVGYFLFGGVLSLAWGTYIFAAKRREWYGLRTMIGSIALMKGEVSDE